MKNKEYYIEEYIEYLYGDISEEDKPIYQPEITQSRADFKSGFNLAEKLFKPKWVDVNYRLPDNDILVIVKISNSRKQEIECAYYKHNKWNDGCCGDSVEINNFKVIAWMNIPQ